jgi:hypothetical protein
MPEINEKIQFIFAGSIGLENVVDFLNASATINDLYSFAIPPFTKTEAKSLVSKLIEGSEYNFIKELLNYLSEHNTIPSGEIRDLAAAFEIETEYVNILNALKYDGYINNHDDPKVYRFNSPLLKMWWNKNVAN